MLKITHNLLCKKWVKSRYFCGRILCSQKVYEVFHVCSKNNKNKLCQRQFQTPFSRAFWLNILKYCRNKQRFKSQVNLDKPLMSQGVSGITKSRDANASKNLGKRKFCLRSQINFIQTHSFIFLKYRFGRTRSLVFSFVQLGPKLNTKIGLNHHPPPGRRLRFGMLTVLTKDLFRLNTKLTIH